MPAPSALAVSLAPSTLLVVVLDVVLILVAARLAGRAAARLGQPPVIGEILAGIALGPSLLGLVGPDLPGTLFPDDARAWLGHLGELGLVLFLFAVGRESDPGLLRRAGGRIGALSVGSIVVPATVGVLVALPLWADHATVAGEEVPRAAFAAFLAVALSVTAFPVLARILGDAGLLRSETGRTAMAVAAVTDLVAWSALAVVVGLTGTGGRSPAQLVGLVVLYGVALRYALRPAVAAALGRLAAAPGPEGDGGPTLTRARWSSAGVLLAGLLLSAGATDAIGLHAAIGAFAFGVLCPRDGAAGRTAGLGAAGLARAGLLLVPVFFLSTGLTVDLASLSPGDASELVLLLVAAVASKFVGVAVAARRTGDGPREAAALGVLLNARGLTELVVLEVGRSAGILDDRIFAALVAVALLTTVVTGPLFRRLHADGPGGTAGRGGPGGPDGTADRTRGPNRSAGPDGTGGRTRGPEPSAGQDRTEGPHAVGRSDGEPSADGGAGPSRREPGPAPVRP